MANIPLFTTPLNSELAEEKFPSLCTRPQDNIQEIYYFRWYIVLKHIPSTPDGYVTRNSCSCEYGRGKTIHLLRCGHQSRGKVDSRSSYLDDNSRFLGFDMAVNLVIIVFWQADANLDSFILATGNSPRSSILTARPCKQF